MNPMLCAKNRDMSSSDILAKNTNKNTLHSQGTVTNTSSEISAFPL